MAAHGASLMVQRKEEPRRQRVEEEEGEEVRHRRVSACLVGVEAEGQLLHQVVAWEIQQ